MDWRHLKDKIGAGADYVLTQFFFDNADFFMFRDHLTRRLSVNVPLVPGVIPILSAAQITKFAQLSGGKIPLPLRAKLDELSGDDDAVTEFGIEYATRQCEDRCARAFPACISTRSTNPTRPFAC